MSFAIQSFSDLANLTIVPDPVQDTKGFREYLTRTYEEIALVVNNRVTPYYTISISDTAENIPNLPQYGSFFVAVSGIYSSQPTGIWALVKSTSTTSGLGLTPISYQPGSGDWATFTLTITSTATNFQIAHTNTGVTDNFNISVLGTQIISQ